MKIGIIGSRGIPNHYGGFEQFAESLSLFLAEKNHDIYVYNSSNHPYKLKQYQGVQIIHCADPEKRIGSFGQFIYDLNCIRDSRKRDFDVILFLGYTSSSIWASCFPKNAVVITNMDGLEWKRQKYNYLTRKFLKFAEKLAVKNSDYLISDSKGIQTYLAQNYNIHSHFIAYGSTYNNDYDTQFIDEYQVRPHAYYLIVARLEPENNVKMILDGMVQSKVQTDILVIGSTQNKFGRKIAKKFRKHLNIRFMEGIYDQQKLTNLRHYSSLYFHGHSVGGTNPSLLEAMGSEALIIAHDNQFNRAVLEKDAYYFSQTEDIVELIHQINPKDEIIKIQNNLHKIKTIYNCNLINNQYLNLFNDCVTKIK